MADLKDEASAAYQVTKADAKILYARQQVMWQLMGPGGTSGPELTKVLQEFYGYIATWDTLKQDPAYKADPAQLSGLAQTVSSQVDVFIARAQQAKAIDDAKGASKPAAPPPGPKGGAKPAPPPPAAPPSPAEAAPPPPRPTGPTKALGDDKMLLIAAVGLGAAALLLGKSRK